MQYFHSLHACVQLPFPSDCIYSVTVARIEDWTVNVLLANDSQSISTEDTTIRAATGKPTRMGTPEEDSRMQTRAQHKVDMEQRHRVDTEDRRSKVVMGRHMM